MREGGGSGGVGAVDIRGGGGVIKIESLQILDLRGLAGMYLPTSIDFERRNKKEPPFQQVL